MTNPTITPDATQEEPQEIRPNNITQMPQRGPVLGNPFKSAFGAWLLYVGLALAVTAVMAFILSQVDGLDLSNQVRQQPRHKRAPSRRRRDDDDDEDDEDEDDDDDDEDTVKPRRRRKSTPTVVIHNGSGGEHSRPAKAGGSSE